MKDDLKWWAGASLQTVIEGRSIIDSERLQLHSLDEAEAFLNCYGFDWQVAEERWELEKLRQEALEFIEEILLFPGQLVLGSVRTEVDVRQLLVWVSENGTSQRRLWSCALLRVMHTFAHCGSYFNEHYQQEIREQLLSLFKAHLHYHQGAVSLGDIELAGFESRPSKTRRSVALKLLHKPENVAADIFDWVGVRIVTRYRLDALKVLAYLRKHNLVMFANIKPSRTRNTLLNVDWIQSRWGTESFTDFDKLRENAQLMEYPSFPPQSTDNPFSEATYHALQFTCRQRIRFRENDGRLVRFYFPYEIQILDEESYRRSRSGRASHDKYKQRQLKAIRARVLGSALVP